MRGVPSCPIDFHGRSTSLRGRVWDRLQIPLARLLCSGWAARLSRALGLNGQIEVVRHELPLERDHAIPLRIAFASDFHAGATTHPALLEEACAALEAMQPDLLLLGGDYIAFEAREVEVLVPMLARLEAPLGKFAVLGNHDLCTTEGHVIDALARAGVRVLRNESVRLAAPHDDVWLCGLDDPIYGEPRPDEAVAEAAGHRVVLMHAPDGLLALGERPFRIAFCGHTHGGQVALPGGRGIVMPKGKLSRRYQAGTYPLEGGRTLVVSRGIGCSTLPVRLFSPAQVHECVVRALTRPTAGYAREEAARTAVQPG